MRSTCSRRRRRSLALPTAKTPPSRLPAARRSPAGWRKSITSLPPWVPLASLYATVTDPVLSAALTDDERAWIMGQITEIRDKIGSLDWPLGIGLIHGDAWAGNLLWSPGAVPVDAILGDWDWVSTGPREIDLIPTWHATARYGKPASWVSDFTAHYGYDLARWEGYPVLMAMRDLVQLTG